MTADYNSCTYVITIRPYKTKDAVWYLQKVTQYIFD
jgi:hypothetical protein